MLSSLAGFSCLIANIINFVENFSDIFMLGPHNDFQLLFISILDSTKRVHRILLPNTFVLNRNTPLPNTFVLNRNTPRHSNRVVVHAAYLSF